MASTQPQMRPAAQFGADCRQAFPYLRLVPMGREPDGVVTSRRIANRSLGLVRSNAHRVEALPPLAESAGLNDFVKLLWLTHGTASMAFENKVVRVRAGDMLVMPISKPYQLTAETGFEAMTLIFDPRLDPHWSQIARGKVAQPFKIGRTAGAAAACLKTLFDDTEADPADTMVIDTALGLARWTFDPALDEGERTGEQQPGFLDRARHHVEQHLGDPAYSPGQLADDLGVSRRVLYATFARLGSTPSTFMRHVRLEESHRAIRAAGSDRVSLTRIAMETGFADSAAFSRAFRAKYGIRPRDLRALA